MVLVLGHFLGYSASKGAFSCTVPFRVRCFRIGASTGGPHNLTKGRLYTTGKVIQRLFIIDFHTQLAIYKDIGEANGKSSIFTIK